MVESTKPSSRRGRAYSSQLLPSERTMPSDRDNLGNQACSCTSKPDTVYPTLLTLMAATAPAAPAEGSRQELRGSSPGSYHRTLNALPTERVRVFERLVSLRTAHSCAYRRTPKDAKLVNNRRP